MLAAFTQFGVPGTYVTFGVPPRTDNKQRSALPGSIGQIMEAVAVLANIKGTVQSFVLGFLDIA